MTNEEIQEIILEKTKKILETTAYLRQKEEKKVPATLAVLRKDSQDFIDFETSRKLAKAMGVSQKDALKAMGETIYDMEKALNKEKVLGFAVILEVNKREEEKMITISEKEDLNSIAISMVTVTGYIKIMIMPNKISEITEVMESRWTKFDDEKHGNPIVRYIFMGYQQSKLRDNLKMK